MTSSTAAAPASSEVFGPDHEHWVDRFLAAERKLHDARLFVLGAGDGRRISVSQRDAYSAMIDQAHQRAIEQQLADPANVDRPGYPGAEKLTAKARALAAEEACVAVRDKAIVLYRDGDICDDARDEFLSTAGLDPYEGDD